MAFQRNPGLVKPALATQVDRVPSGTRWIHEIKFDGYRVQLHIANDDIKVFTRRGNDWTKRLKKIAIDAYEINAGSAIIDGEIVVPSPDGTTDFSVLQNELKGNSTKVVMVAFDLLYLNGYDLRKLPLVQRKTHLKKLIDGPPSNSAKALYSTVARCTSTPVKWGLRASSRKFGTAAMARAAAETG